MTNAHEQFNITLLAKVSQAYENSPSSKFDPKLHYSVAAIPIRQNKGLIIGINWGGSGANYEAESSMPNENELTTDIIYKDYKFLKRSKENLEKYFNLKFDKVDFNYSNICFFRTRQEKELTMEDYKQSFPLFMEYVQYVKPSWILSFGVTSVTRIKQIDNAAITNKEPIFDDENKFCGYKGFLFGIPFYCLPHPNARLKKTSRDRIWGKMKIQIPAIK